MELLTSFWQTFCKILLRLKMRNFTMWGVWNTLLHSNRRFIKILLRWKMRNFTMWGVWNSLLHSDRRFVKSFCVEKWKIYHVRSMELLTSFWQTLCKIFLRWEMRNFTMLRSMEHLTSFWQTLCKIFLRWKMKNFTMWGVWNSLLHSDRRFVKSFCVEKWEILPCEECGNPYFILTDAL